MLYNLLFGYGVAVMLSFPILLNMTEAGGGMSLADAFHKEMASERLSGRPDGEAELIRVLFIALFLAPFFLIWIVGDKIWSRMN